MADREELVGWCIHCLKQVDAAHNCFQWTISYYPEPPRDDVIYYAPAFTDEELRQMYQDGKPKDAE